ncbi:MAG: LysR substrate-binding domain-containing protein [Eubacteriales bacterium]|nr:LysR substrate-binding domain-containing protein [Eubacteriales bacterium]
MPGAQYVEVLRQNGVIAINRNNPIANIQNLSMSMLADESFIAISPEESPNGYALLIEQCNAAGFMPRIVRTLNSLESLLLCVEAGLGVTMLDQNTRLEHNTEVRSIPIPNSAPSAVCAVWLETNRNPNIRQLVTALQESHI